MTSQFRSPNLYYFSISHFKYISVVLIFFPSDPAVAYTKTISAAVCWGRGLVQLGNVGDGVSRESRVWGIERATRNVMS